MLPSRRFTASSLTRKTFGTKPRNLGVAFPHSVDQRLTFFTVIDSNLIEIFLHFENHFAAIEGKPINCPSASFVIGEDIIALEHMPQEFTSLREARVYLDLIRRVSLKVAQPENGSATQSNDEILPSDSEPREESSLSVADQWYHRSMLCWQNSFSPLLRGCRANSSTVKNFQAAAYLEMKQLIIDLDRPETLQSYYPNTTALDLCMRITTLASRLLDSEDEVLSRGPTMPRYDMLLEEVVSPMLRAADRCDATFIRNLANDLLRRYSASEELDWVKWARSKALGPETAYLGIT